MAEFKHGDLAFVQTTGSIALARYTDWDQAYRDEGIEPELLISPYWSYFGTEYSSRVDETTVVKRVRLADINGNLEK